MAFAISAILTARLAMAPTKLIVLPARCSTTCGRKDPTTAKRAAPWGITHTVRAGGESTLTKMQSTLPLELETGLVTCAMRSADGVGILQTNACSVGVHMC